MAKFQWTGAGETVGQAPTLLSSAWGGSLSEWEVQADANADNEGKVLAFVGTGDARRALQIIAAGSSIDGRIDARGRFWKAGNDSSLAFSRVNIGGGAGNETSVYCDYSSSNGWRLARYDSGGFATAASSTTSAGEGWYRFRVIYNPGAASDRYQIWVWPDADPEPTTPSVLENGALINPPGGIGFGIFSAQEAYLDWISYGTGGDDADDLSIAALQTIRKSSTFDVETTLGTITTATLNGVNVFDHVTGQVGTTLSFEGAATDEITTSGEYDLVLGDGTGTETITVQVNVYGVAPSNNPLQKDGSALASLTGVQVRITDGSDLNGAQLEYLPAATTDASGNLGNIDLSATAVADTDPVLLHLRTAAGDSIIASETVGLI